MPLNRWKGDSWKLQIKIRTVIAKIRQIGHGIMCLLLSISGFLGVRVQPVPGGEGLGLHALGYPSEEVCCPIQVSQEFTQRLANKDFWAKFMAKSWLVWSSLLDKQRHRKGRWATGRATEPSSQHGCSYSTLYWSWPLFPKKPAFRSPLDFHVNGFGLKLCSPTLQQ